MSRRSDGERPQDMLEHAEHALDLVRGRAESDLISDRHFRAACERYIEIIGEAANHVSPAVRERLPDLPWSDIVRTRNILAHGYATVRADILWDIAQVHLPVLVEGVRGLLHELDEKKQREET